MSEIASRRPRIGPTRVDGALVRLPKTACVAVLLWSLLAGWSQAGVDPARAAPAARPVRAGVVAGSTVLLHPADSVLYLPSVCKSHLRDFAGVFGVQISEVRFRQPDMIRAVRDAGAGWWRTFLFWDEVEPSRSVPPTYDWSLYDPLFQTASEAGLEVIAEIQGNPRWVADFPGGPVRDLDALAQFVSAAVERYDGDGYRDCPGHPVVRFWELYNEPDNVDAQLAVDGRGWGFWGFEGAEYARMLKRVYPAVKIASPSARVVFGGVAYDGFIPNDGPFNPAFVDDVLAADGGDFFDVMNYHYYPLFAGNWSRYGVGIIGKTAAIRAKLAEYGLDKRLFVTEAGSWSAASPPYPSTTPQEQAYYVAQLHARALVAGVSLVCWFQFDDVEGADDPARGLLDSDLAAKPALAAYRTASDMLAGAHIESVQETPDPDHEVYWFRRGLDRLAVAWTNDGSIRELELTCPAARRTRATGAAVTVADDADGALDGRTHVPYGREPVYVQPVSCGP